MNEHRENLLKAEYLFLQNTYEDFDRRVFIIKGWSVTLALGGIVVGFQYTSVAILALAGLASLLFWVLEAIWKFFQYCNSPRISAIESYFRGEIDELPPLQSYTTWFKTFRATTGWTMEIIGNMFLVPVLIPHAPALLLIIVLIAANGLGFEIFANGDT